MNTITILYLIVTIVLLYFYFIQGKGNRNLFELVEFSVFALMFFYSSMILLVIIYYLIFKIFEVKVNALEKFKQIYF